MATNTGHVWGSFARMDYSSGTPVNSIDVNDEATLTTDEYPVPKCSGIEVSIKWVEGNDGAVDGDLYIYVLRPDGAGGWQTINDPAYSFAMDVVQNATKVDTISINPKDMGSFKILVDNDSGQDGDLTLSVRYADVPAAVA